MTALVITVLEGDDQTVAALTDEQSGYVRALAATEGPELHTLAEAARFAIDYAHSQSVSAPAETVAVGAAPLDVQVATDGVVMDFGHGIDPVRIPLQQGRALLWMLARKIADHDVDPTP